MHGRRVIAMPLVCLAVAGCEVLAAARDEAPRPPRVSASAIDAGTFPEQAMLPLPADAGAVLATLPYQPDSAAIATVLPADAAPLVDPGDDPSLDCRTRLRARGVNFTTGRTHEGIEDPVTVIPPIDGVHYLASSFTGPERPLPMDCRLALALHTVSRQLRTTWRITDVVHYGAYYYRCIPNTEPCRLSRHALGLAIDIHAVRDSDRKVYSVSEHFWENGRPTCPARAADAEDQTLKDIACWMHNARAFSIVLTPNYNAAHRNHFHLDLSPVPQYLGADLFSEIDPPRFPGHGTHPEDTDDSDLVAIDPHPEAADDVHVDNAACVPLSNASPNGAHSARCFCALH